jgi:hypothetical protein
MQYGLRERSVSIIYRNCWHLSNNVVLGLIRAGWGVAYRRGNASCGPQRIELRERQKWAGRRWIKRTAIQQINRLVTHGTRFATREMLQRAKGGGGILRNWRMAKRQSQFGSHAFAKFEHRFEWEFRRKHSVARRNEISSAIRKTAECEFGWNAFSRWRVIRREVGSAHLATFEDPAREASLDFELDPLLEDLAKFLAEIGNAIETRVFKALKAILGKRQQRLERRVRAAHGSALPGL